MNKWSFKLDSKLLLVLALIFQVGCGSILKNKLEKLPIDTTPPGAKIKVAGQICHSPCDLEVERGKDLVLNISKPGYKPVDMTLKGNSFDMMFYGNFVFFYFFPIGMGIDYYTGKAFDFDPEHLKVEMEKL